MINNTSQGSTAITTVPLCAQLAESGPRQPRWMSLPSSPLVLNPTDFQSAPLPLTSSTLTAFPLEAGYYAGGNVVRAADLLSIYRRDSNEPGQSETGWQEDFSANASEWKISPNAKAEFGTDRMSLRAMGPLPECDACAPAERWVEIDLDQFPFLEVTVPECAGKWSAKIVSSPKSRAVILRADNKATGTFAWNISTHTGWTGKKRFLLRFYAVGIDQPAVFTSVRFIGIRTASRSFATSVSATWEPHVLTTHALYEDGLSLEVRDCMVDEHSVLRSLYCPIRSGKPYPVFTLTGTTANGAVWNAEEKMLCIDFTTCTCAIAMPTTPETSPVRYCSTPADLLLGGDVDHPQSDTNHWTCDVTPGLSEKKGLSSSKIAMGWASAEEGVDVAIARAGHARKVAETEDVRKRQQTFWDEYLARVPSPSHFELNGIDTHGVTSDAIRRAYYQAWVFLAANVLPPDPAHGYSYPQLPAGKPSLWMEGHPKARASASWESLFAMQFYAFVDSAAAWQAYEGHMSLVDGDGALRGESLPSRKAQTAHLVYAVSGDREALRRVYPALKRHLLWAEKNPRWIHGNHNYPGERDADFVSSLLFDVKHAVRIAEILDMPEDAAFWTKKRAAWCADYLKDFWESPDADPVEYIGIPSGRSRGNGLWVASGIAVDLIGKGPHLDGLLRRMRENYRPDALLNGFIVPKHPEISMLVYGLMERGMEQDAAIIANTYVRDVTRSGMFAEQYRNQNEFPEPDGVRPSIFGLATLIDMLWLKNGLRTDQGKPLKVQLPGEKGSVTNLPVFAGYVGQDKD